ncbi:MAG: InlB B-repeat-containing protein [Oscillospiraceae bacterium]|nr:InlB B-repeat-containing protein [Oscillospiraceae bacterium]
MKQILALILTFILIFGTLPMAAFGEVETFEEQETFGEFETIVPLSGFTVTFMPNGGLPIDPSVAIRTTQLDGTIGAANMPPSQAVLRDGFMLFHWNTNPAGGAATVFTGETIVEQNMSVYAIWGLPVEFLGNGVILPMYDNPSDSNDYSPRVVLAGDSVDQATSMTWPSDPERQGFTFGGWWNMPINFLEYPTNVISPVGALQYFSNTPIIAGVTLHARWIMNDVHTLTFIASSPTGGALQPCQTATRSGVEGISIADSHYGPFWLNREPDPTTPQENGIPIDRAQTSPWATHPSATLHSWRWLPHGGGTQAGAVFVSLLSPPLPHLLTESANVYANWVYRVAFEPNGGSFANPDNPANPSTSAFMRDIQTVNTDGTPTGGGIVANDSVTWVTWPLPPNNIQPVTFFPTPERAGYTFYGWWTAQVNPHDHPDPTDPGDAAPGEQFFPNSTWVDSSRQVWARWIPGGEVRVRLFVEDGQWVGLTPFQQNTNHGHALTVNSPYQWRDIPSGSSIRVSGGTSVGPGASSGNAHGSPVYHPIGGMPNVPIRTGYVFMGFWTEPNGGGTIFNGATIVNSNTDVFAYWVPAITINLNFHGGTQANGNAITPANHVRVVPLGYSLSEVAQAWRNMRGVAAAGNAAHLPLYYRPNVCTGLREGLGNLYVYGAVHQGGVQAGVFSTEPGGLGERFGMNTVVDAVWMAEHGATPTTATVHAVWAPIVTFNRNHNTFASGHTNLQIMRQVTCNRSFATNTIKGLRNPTPPVLPPAQTPLSTQWATIANWPQLALDGRVFLGWFTTPGTAADPMAGTRVTEECIITHDTTLYARFAFGLEFHPNGAPADIIASGDQIRYVASVPSPALGDAWPDDPVWIRNGVSVPFLGWNTRPDAGGIPYSRYSQIMNSRRLYAIWGSGVFFDANGGRFANNNTITEIPFFGAPLGESLATVPTPTFTTPNGNLEFRHWNTQESTLTTPGIVVTTALTPVDAQTFWAQWNVPITFNPGIGEWPSGTSTGNRIHRAPYGGSLNPDTTGWSLADNDMPSNPALANHTFMGWRYNGQAANAPHMTSEQVLNASQVMPRTYTAVFYLNVTFDFAGGTYPEGVPADRAATDPLIRPTALNAAVASNRIPQIPNLERSGFVFIGWRYDNQAAGTPNLQAADIAARNVTVPLTYTAQWGREVRFNLNGGTYQPGIPANRPFGTELLRRAAPDGGTLTAFGTMPGNPSRTGYHFVGWQRVTPPIYPSVIETPEEVGTTARVTYGGYEYIAVWHPVITFNLNGGNYQPGVPANRPSGTENVTRIVPTDGMLYTTPAPNNMPGNPERTGLVFAGWRNAAGDIIQPNDVANTVRTVTATYVAVWNPVITAPVNNALSRNIRQPINGTGLPGEVIYVEILDENDDVIISGNTSVAANGTWVFTTGIDIITPNPYLPFRFTARARHEHGLGMISDWSNEGSFLLKSAIADPTFDDEFVGTESDPAIVDEIRPTITGEGEPGATVTLRIYNGGNTLVGEWEIDVATDGTWSFTPDVDLEGNKDYRVTISQEDQHGNYSNDVDTWIRIDTRIYRRISGFVLYDGWSLYNQVPTATVRLYNAADSTFVAQTTASVFVNYGYFEFVSVDSALTYYMVIHKQNHTGVIVQNITFDLAAYNISGNPDDIGNIDYTNEAGTRFLLFAGNMDAINDGEINTLDWSLLVNSMFQTHAQALEQDLNDDGQINVLDQSLLLNNFLQINRVVQHNALTLVP